MTDTVASTADTNIMVGLIAFITTFLVFFIILGIVWYVLNAFGYYRLAKNRGLEHAWIAWIPVCQYYLLGELIDNRVWGIGYANWILVLSRIVVPILSSYSDTSNFMAMLASIVAIVFFIYSMTALYKLYQMYTNHPVALLVTSIIIPVATPVIIFCIRNNAPTHLSA